MIVCLAKIFPLDPATGNRVEVRLSAYADNQIGRAINSYGDQVWEPALVKAPSLRISLFDGAFGSAIAAGQTSLSINMGEARKTWPLIDTFAWPGSPVELWAGNWEGTPSLSKVFDGRLQSFGRQADTLNISASVDQEPFQANVLTATYAGTGGAEGDDNLKGRVKPLVLGWAQNVEPLLIDAVNSVYQFSGYGAIEAVTTLYERGSDFVATGGTMVGDFASYAALVAATIPRGSWATCLAQGMVRLGAPQFGVITGDIKGHRVGANTPRLTGAIINALTSISGVSSSLIDTASLSALDAAVARNVNIVITDQTSLLAIAQDMALPCNAQAGVGLDGRLFATRMSFASASQMIVNAQGRAWPQVLSSVEEAVSPPFWRSVMGANRSWRVHTPDEIASDVPIGPTDNSPTPPTEMVNGGLWIAPDGHPYRFSFRAWRSAGADWTGAGGAWLGSGYADAQDQAGPNALTAAEAATALALDAQATADGKVQSFYQASAPTAEGVGDLWFDTDDGNKQYRWSGSAWVAVQDGAIGTALTAAAGAQATADGKVTTFIAETAPTAEAEGDLWFKASTGELRRWSGSSWGTPLVDLTAVQQVTVAPPAGVIVYCDVSGTPKAGQLAKVLTPVVTRGGTDIRTDNAVSYAISAPAQLAATINNAAGNADKGRITIGTGWTGPGTAQMTVTVSGVAYGPFPIAVDRVNDQPSAPSGGGGGSGPAYDSTFNSVTSTTMAAISDDLGPLTLASGQALIVTAPLDYEVSASSEVFKRLVVRARYSSDGGATWNTFSGGNVTGSEAHFDPGGFINDPGSVSFSQSQTGLPAGSYLVRLEGALNNSSLSPTINVSSGTMTYSIA